MKLEKKRFPSILNCKFLSISELLKVGDEFSIFAGPCAVESYEQMEATAKTLIEQNVKILRAGAYKPRTSLYDFQGLEKEGLKILELIKKTYNLFVTTEIVDVRHIDLHIRYTDIIQVGARNMQNFSLLKELGRIDKPVVLKRGFASTLEEFLSAAEYIVSSGNKNIILCERGIRTFENSTRNTLDISSVAFIKEHTDIPIIVDVSHSLGRKDIVKRVSKAVKAVGADGLMVEVHPEPSVALSDKQQQLDFSEFRDLMQGLL